jgi:hypothetical protein
MDEKKENFFSNRVASFLYSGTVMNFVLLIVLLTHHTSANCVANCKCPMSDEVDCSYTSLKQLPRLDGYPKMLNASHNRVMTLKRITFQTLATPGHDTGIINKSVSLDQGHLEIIDLSWNSIAFMHSEVFAFTPKLTWLSLANNAALQLSENGLFVIVKSLKILDFSYCNISKIGEHTFKTGNHSLEKLYLQHNIISSVHKNAFISFEHLKVLDLSYNRLFSLRITALIPLKQINVLKLQNNSFLCECSIQDIYNWSIVQGVQLNNVTCNILNGEFGLPWSEQIKNMNCGNMRGRRHANIESLPASDSDEEIISSPILITIIVVLVIVVLIAIVCACLLSRNRECMEAIGCILICEYCFQ